MRVEQGVKILTTSEAAISVPNNEHFIIGTFDSGFIIHKAEPDNPKEMIGIIFKLETAIKIAKFLNKGGQDE
ncbi:hypothetical protein [Entomomonas asaccharolytica]|uniref:Uncharacterized protein n=1 Tax=Entomomonas asaccharolytica TaxID=2785331 RepID=A0A974NIA7_9GAMM|nr:hypothetical protein [Entomomonas asaccharolytica]QQP86897.1 hypothetical protein JHT90_06545 [Entomomonas asaccharolytica]